MSRLIGAIIFWLIGVSAIAQVKITVVDQTTGEKLEGVSVVVKSSGTEQMYITEGDGTVIISNAAFPLVINTSHIGYATQQKEITTEGDYLFSLKLSALQLNEVVVTGQFEPQSVRQSVYQVRTITNERIMLRSPVNVQGALSTELGIRFSNDLTLGTSDITLMGMSGRNVKILVDGAPLLDRGDTRESLNQIDVNTIDKIEIVEGPMSVLYGTDALAGVINIITKKQIGNTLSIEARVHEETAAKEYKPFTGKGVHNQSININWGGNKLYAGAGITRNTHGGWKEGRPYFDPNLPPPYAEWRPKDQWLTQSTLGYRTQSLNIWYRLNYLNETITQLGNAAVENQTTFVDKKYTTNRFTHQAQADWEINDRWTFNGVVTYQDLSRKTLTTNYDQTTGEETLSTETGSQDEALFDMAMVRGFFLYKLAPKLSLQPGFEINFNSGSGERIDRNRSITDYAAFVSGEFKPTPSINIRPGLRFIYNSAYDAPPVIPSLNTKFSLGNAFDLRFAYAYGFRSPALRELYFYFHDGSHDIDGNRNLKAEYSNSFSSSLTWTRPQPTTLRIKSTLGAFYNMFDNLITLVSLNPNSALFIYDNIAKHKTTGATLENNFYLGNLALTIGGSYIGRYNDLTEGDDSVPEFNWSTELNTVASYSFPNIGNTISVYYKFTGKRQSYYRDGDDIVLGETEGFHLLDASVSQSFLKYLTFTAGVRNLLDVTRLTNTAQIDGGAHTTVGSVPMSYGRSYFATLAFQWSK